MNFNLNINSIKMAFCIGLLVSVVVSIFIIFFPIETLSLEKKNDVCSDYDAHKRIIYIKCETNLSEISKSLADNKILIKESPDGVWFLNSSIVILKGGILNISDPEVKWLKISSQGRSTGIGEVLSEGQNASEPTPYLIQTFGGIKIQGTKVTSWDPSIRNYTFQNPKGTIPRPYVTVEVGASPSVISNSEIAYLGYQSTRKQGINFYGGEGSRLIDNRIHNLWFGFYSTAVGHILIENNSVYDNLKYGLDPHTGTHDLILRNNIVHNNGHIGIICSIDCKNMTIENNTVFNNTNAGIMLSKNVQNSIVKGNKVYHENTGVAISESTKNEINGNMINETEDGIQLKLKSSSNKILENSIHSTKRCGIEISNYASFNMVNSNKINSKQFGVCLIDNPSGNTLSKNTIQADTGKAVYARNSKGMDNRFTFNIFPNVTKNPVILYNSTLIFVNNTIG